MLVGMVLLALLLGLARADAPPTVQDGRLDSLTRRPLAGRPVLDLRAAASSAGDGVTPDRPAFCVAGLPHRRIVLEGCGNGSGLFHHADAPELAHFRGAAVLVDHSQGALDLSLLLGAGLAELQVAADEPGFKTGAARSSDQVEAAGPEASMGFKGRWWGLPGAYLVGDVNVGAAHLPAAPAVLGRGGTVLPFATIGVGVGF